MAKYGNLTVPKQCDGLPLTGKEKSWAQICDSLGLDSKSRNAHKLIIQKYPELHRKVHQHTALVRVYKLLAGAVTKNRAVTPHEVDKAIKLLQELIPTEALEE